MNDIIRVFSYGGGVQSTAVLVLQATGRLPQPYDVFLFANVGADSENPDTLTYVSTYAKPYAARHGIAFQEVHKETRGEPETLYQYLQRAKSSIPIPMKTAQGAPGRRACTSDFKIAVIDRAIRALGYRSAVTGLGISVDEYHRARDGHWYQQNGLNKKREYPLIDLRLSRSDCQAIIASAGLPEPPKSSCWFCPFKRPAEWLEMRRTKPELFEKAVALERMLNERRRALGRDPMFIHPALVPLDQAVGLQLALWSDDTCDEGVCFV